MRNLLVVSRGAESYYAFRTTSDILELDPCGMELDVEDLDNECCLDDMPSNSHYVFRLYTPVRKLVWTGIQKKYSASTPIGDFAIMKKVSDWRLYFKSVDMDKYELLTCGKSAKHLQSTAQRFFENRANALISELCE